MTKIRFTPEEVAKAEADAAIIGVKREFILENWARARLGVPPRDSTDNDRDIEAERRIAEQTMERD